MSNPYTAMPFFAPPRQYPQSSSFGLRFAPQAVEKVTAAIRKALDGLVEFSGGALVLPSSATVEIIQPKHPPRLNGVRINFEPKQMGGLSRGQQRWCAYFNEPTRVRTCRGRRR